ncbi:L-histidine N(alpha)-methyltransferase [Aliikangiella coralliicola]|uniref:L-histidine N(Alpha)-methyltransferase n=1 Tax=Aliikangiella coralliicola TaxID=2592383 RepID=A0A545UBW4_9GAMM|nr:L-histidine N(alpha)-methyltransferase [Aliikangiella coralliicola]TQV86956.1 L-histidine N(alpha)-methyltransferase [Aliikangiella coralliicola]
MDAKVGSLIENNNEFYDDVIDGLSKKQKSLPCKYFYDQVGSELFEEICQLDEYYVTRSELELIDTIKSELAQLIGSNAVIIEPGAGAGIKIQKLLATLDTPSTYVPIDISRDFLNYSGEIIKQKFPNIDVFPVAADFTQSFKWLDYTVQSNRVVFFPGSTIGNFDPAQAESFLSNVGEIIGSKGAIIIGVDLVKPIAQLEAAYNDQKGITAEFNKNILVRINNELNGNFDLDLFEHDAFFNVEKSRIEMHLKSKEDQSVIINEQQIDFKESERIHTENSYKYSIDSFVELAQRAGLKRAKSWVDSNNRVSMHYLVNQ